MSARGTMSPTEACQAGLFSAMPQPIRNVKVEQQPRREQAEPAEHRERGRDREHEALRDQHDHAAIVIVGDRAGGEREQHHRERVRGLHQRDQVGRARDRGHQPGGRDGLDQPAEIGGERREPDGAEDRLGERNERRGRRPARARARGARLRPVAYRGRRACALGSIGTGRDVGTRTCANRGCNRRHRCRLRHAGPARSRAAAPSSP